MPAAKKLTWTVEEDAILKKVLNEAGVQRLSNGAIVLNGSWGDVAMHLPGRSAKQCRERWRFNLCPDINKSEWSCEEDATLIQNQLKVGNQWALIARQLDGRTENSVKIRFKSILRASRRVWTAKDDTDLLALHKLMGSKWGMIAERMPNRTRNGVKTRFLMLRNGIAERPLHPGAAEQLFRDADYSDLVEQFIHNSGVRSMPESKHLSNESATSSPQTVSMSEMSPRLESRSSSGFSAEDFAAAAHGAQLHVAPPLVLGGGFNSGTSSNQQQHLHLPPQQQQQLNHLQQQQRQQHQQHLHSHNSFGSPNPADEMQHQQSSLGRLSRTSSKRSSSWLECDNNSSGMQAHPEPSFASPQLRSLQQYQQKHHLPHQHANAPTNFKRPRTSYPEGADESLFDIVAPHIERDWQMQPHSNSSNMNKSAAQQQQQHYHEQQSSNNSSFETNMSNSSTGSNNLNPSTLRLALALASSDALLPLSAAALLVQQQRQQQRMADEEQQRLRSILKLY